MPFLFEDLTSTILSVCFEVINELGSGFLETVYEKALLIALHQKGLNAVAQYPIEVSFRGHNVGQYFADILVENTVIVEIKTVTTLAPEHKAQVINHLKASNIEVGLLVNFGNPKFEYKRLHK
jgi:GxxExxY protein